MSRSRPGPPQRKSKRELASATSGLADRLKPCDDRVAGGVREVDEEAAAHQNGVGRAATRPAQQGLAHLITTCDPMQAKSRVVAGWDGIARRPRAGPHVGDPIRWATRQRYLVGEKSVGITNVDSTLPTSGPLASEVSRMDFHDGSFRKSSHDFFAASRLWCEST
jgi:hypothetical protein